MVHSSALNTQDSGRSARSGRARNVRTALLLAATMLGLFTLAVVYISRFH